jgi:hypothetical protein
MARRYDKQSSAEAAAFPAIVSHEDFGFSGEQGKDSFFAATRKTESMVSVVSLHPRLHE